MQNLQRLAVLIPEPKHLLICHRIWKKFNRQCSLWSSRPGWNVELHMIWHGRNLNVNSPRKIRFCSSLALSVRPMWSSTFDLGSRFHFYGVWSRSWSSSLLLFHHDHYYHNNYHYCYYYYYYYYFIKILVYDSGI